MKKFFNEIKNAKIITIFRHENPDGDAAGSSFGLREIILTNFPNKEVYIASYESNNIIEKFFKKTNKISQEVIDSSLSIVCDTANIDRIDGKPNMSNLIKVDHHPNKSEFGKLLVGDTTYSSTCEIVTEFAVKNKLKITKKAAGYLYLGIVTDTGRFQHDITTEKTHIMVAELLKTGYLPKKMYKELYSKSINHLKFENYLISKMKIENGVASLTLPKNKEKKFNLTYDIASSSIYVLMKPFEVKYGMFASYDKTKDKYKVSLRSKSKSVSPICEKFGGGGHNSACGIKVDKKDLKLIREELLKL